MALALLEEHIAGGPEPLPQLVALRSRGMRHWPKLLPLRLPAFDRLSGHSPVGDLDQSFGLLDQIFTQQQVLCPLGGPGAADLFVDQIGGVFEPLPQRLRDFSFGAGPTAFHSPCGFFR